MFGFSIVKPPFSFTDVKAITNCWDCNGFYIGKTKRRLHDRKTEHFKALAKNDNTSAIADHVKATETYIGFCKKTNKQSERFSLRSVQQKKGSKRIGMIIKTVNEFKLTVFHFARPNPMQICACAWIYRWTKKLWKIRTGPPGRRGPWAADLLLANPVSLP